MLTAQTLVPSYLHLYLEQTDGPSPPRLLDALITLEVPNGPPTPRHPHFQAKQVDASNTLEVLRHAAQEGVVYYLGRTHLHMKQL